MMNKIAIMKNKIYRKLHFVFWQKLRPGRWSLYLYSSYRHYKLCGKRKYAEKQKEDGKELYLTEVPNSGAGIGHQLGNWNAGYWYAKLFGVKYAYSPFSNPAWNSFLGFGEGEVSAEQLLKKGYKKRKLPYFDEKSEKDVQMIRDIIHSYAGKRIVFFLELDQFYEKQYGIMDEIRKKFNDAPSREGEKLIYGKESLNIAVHIRRGDIVIGQENQHPDLTKRWLTTEYYVRILKDIVKELEKKYPYKIYLFSQGTEQDFPELKDIPNLVYCLDMPPRESFLHMVKADVLLTSKSSFSYKPALMSDGVKICPAHFWHGYPETKEWIPVDEEKGMTLEQLKSLCEQIQQTEKRYGETHEHN